MHFFFFLIFGLNFFVFGRISFLSERVVKGQSFRHRPSPIRVRLGSDHINRTYLFFCKHDSSYAVCNTSKGFSPRDQI